MGLLCLKLNKTGFRSPFLLSLLLMPVLLAFQGRYSLITQTWFGSDSIQFQYQRSICWIRSSHFLWPHGRTAGSQPSETWILKLVEGTWVSPGRFWARTPATGFSPQVPGWQESQREASKTYFPLVYETFHFQNGLRSDRNTTRHAKSLNMEGLQCVLEELESLICMNVHGTISPCNTLQRLKNQCPRAQKDEYRAFQLSFFPP